MASTGEKPHALRRALTDPHLLFVLRAALGAIFIWAAASKIVDPETFIVGIQNYGLIPQGLAVPLGYGLPWVELVAGFCLVAGIFPRVAGAVCAVLLAVFAVTVVSVLLRPVEARPESCACFGPGDTLSWWTPVRDFLLLGLSLVVALSRHRAFRLDGLLLMKAEPGKVSARRAFRRRVQGWVLMLASFGVLILFIFQVLGGVTIAPRTGFRAPSFGLMTLEGKPFDSESLRGRPALLVFWSPECPHCLRELPVLERLYRKFNPELRFVGVAVWEPAWKSGEVVNRLGITFPIVLDRNNSVSRLYEVHAVPCIFLLGPRGVVRKRIEGALPGERLERLLKGLLS